MEICMAENETPAPVSRRGFISSALAGAAVSVFPGQLPGEAATDGHSKVADNDKEEQGPAASLTSKDGALIGNVHALLPGAIAFIKDHKAGIVLDIGSDTTGRPGTTSPDFSYGTWNFQVESANLSVEWGRVGAESAVFRIRTDRNVTMQMTIPANPWRPFFHEFIKAENGIDANAITFDGNYIPWSLRVDPASLHAVHLGSDASIELQITPEHPARFVAGYSSLPAIEAVDLTLDRASAHYARHRAQAHGAWGDFAGAITDNLNNNRLYSSLTQRVGNVIGRSGWLVKDPDFLPYFTWDSSFNGLLASIEDPSTAMETIRTVLRYQLPDGMISQVTEWPTGTGSFVNTACSNPPVTALCAWKLYQRWGDRQFLKDVYPRLLRWHDWWPQFSDGNRNGLLEWGSKVDFRLARLATGWDDTPHFDGAEFRNGQMTADAVDLNSLWSLDAETLSKIATALNRPEDAHRLQAEHLEMNRRINASLWNEELGLYCTRLWSENGKPGDFLTRITPMNFYPLICGAPDAGRAQRVLQTLTDPRKFWGPWLMPTLPYDDPEYATQEYWKGHVWGPVNYLVWQGLRRYGTQSQQAEFARRSVSLFMRNWTTRGTCNENYRSTDGSGDDHPHYTWGALLCQIGIEAIFDIDANGLPFGLQNNALTEDLELRNVPAGGRLYTISLSGGITKIRAQSNSA
jgi:hypothetical protein